MKKLILSLIAVTAVACAALSAAKPAVKDLGDGTWYLENGKVSMIISAQAGAKILSCKYDGKEVLNQSEIPNYFGSTFWPSPQAVWNWPPIPEYDNRPYSVEKHGKSLVMTSSKSQKYPWRFRKEFTAKGKAMVMTYTIINESAEPQQVAPWEVSRVQSDGLIFFDAPLEGITPAGLMPFEERYGLSWFPIDAVERQRKINADGKGWLAYADNGLLFVKKFPDIDVSQPAPREAEIQVYVNQGKTYIEIENQGAYTTLNPGESLSYTVKWYLTPLDGEPVPSEALAKTVKKLIRK